MFKSVKDKKRQCNMVRFRVNIVRMQPFSLFMIQAVWTSKGIKVRTKQQLEEKKKVRAAVKKKEIKAQRVHESKRANICCGQTEAGDNQEIRKHHFSAYKSI